VRASGGYLGMKRISWSPWIETDPKTGWSTILRLHSPTEPFFSKEWRLSDVELVK
jgi:hypothetical protein